MLKRNHTPKILISPRFWQLFVIALLLVCVSLLANHAPVLAADKTVAPDFEMQPVFKGWHRDREWVTLEIKLRNGSQAWRGQVSTTLTYAPGNNYTYSLDVSLEPNEQRQFFFYFLPTRYEPNYDIVLRDADGQPIATKQLHLEVMNRTDYLIGVLTTADKINANLLPQPGIVKVGLLDRRTLVVPLTPADLPEQGETLRPLDTLILTDLDYNALTATQWRVIESWVEDGGKLWLSGGKNFRDLAAKLNPALLPARSNSTTSADQLTARFLPDNLLTNVPLSKNEIQQLVLQPGTFVVSRQEGGNADGWPVVVSRPTGRGIVVVTAFDLLQPPFTEAGKALSTWEALINNVTPDQGYSFLKQELYEKDYIARQLVSLPPLEKFNLIWLLVLGVGLVVTLASSIFVFIKFGRKPLTLIVGVGLLVGAGLLGWQIALVLLVSPVNLGRVSVVTFYADDMPVTVRSINLSKYPDSQQYNLQFDGNQSLTGWLYRPQQVIQPVQQLQAIPPQNFGQGNSALAPVGATSNQGKYLQAFNGHNTLTGKLPIETNLTVSSDGRGLIGSIKNSSEWDLKQVVLVLGNNYLTVGDMPRGEYRQILFNFANRATFLPEQSIEPDLYGVTPQADSSQWLNKLRWTSLNATYLSGQFAPFYQNYSLYFTAWVDDEAATKLVGGVKTADGLPLQMRDYALLVKPLPFSFQASDNVQKLLVPSASLASANLNSINTNYGVDGSAKLTNGGTMLLQYRLPPQLNLSPTRLSLLLKSRRGDDEQNQSNPTIEIYNWNRQSWDTVANQDDKRTRIDLTGANLLSYIEPGGKFIRLRTSVKQGSYTLQQLNIELEGRKA